MPDKRLSLYHGVILAHNQAPLFFEKRPDAQYAVEANNPLCGDKFTLYLDIENGRIARATFHGYGCAVSKASASVLMKKIQGRSLETVQTTVAAFLAALQGEQAPPEATVDEEFLAFLPARDFPGRLQCAVLAWQAMREWMDANR